MLPGVIRVYTLIPGIQMCLLLTRQPTLDQVIITLRFQILKVARIQPPILYRHLFPYKLFGPSLILPHALAVNPILLSMLSQEEVEIIPIASMAVNNSRSVKPFRSLQVFT